MGSLRSQRRLRLKDDVSKIKWYPFKGIGAQKKEARIEIQPRYKIQYPMKNRNKDVVNNRNVVVLF